MGGVTSRGDADRSSSMALSTDLLTQTLESALTGMAPQASVIPGGRGSAHSAGDSRELGQVIG